MDEVREGEGKSRQEYPDREVKELADETGGVEIDIPPGKMGLE